MTATDYDPYRHPRGRDGRFVHAAAVLGTERIEVLRRQAKAVISHDTANHAYPDTGVWRTEAQRVIADIHRSLESIGSVEDIANEDPQGRVVPSRKVRELETSIRELGTILDTEIRARVGEPDLVVAARQAETEAAWRSIALRFDRQDNPGDRAGIDEQIRQADESLLNTSRMHVQATVAHNDAYHNELRRMLGELRPMGGTLAVTPGSDPTGTEATQAATVLVPTDWVEVSNEDPVPLTVNATRTDRSRYDLTTGTLTLGHDGNPHPDTLTAKAAHELAHRNEQTDPTLRVLQWAFLHRRITDPETGDPETPERLTDLTGHPGYGTELACPDHFTNPYIGRIYDGASPTSPYEVLAVGIESLHSGDHGIHEDPDWRAFTIGTLAGA